VPWLRRLVASLSPRKPRFDLSSAHVELVDSVALEHIFIRALRFSLVSFIPPLLHTHLRLYDALTSSTNRRHQGTLPSKKQCYFVNRAAWGRKVLSLFFFFLAVYCPPLAAEAWLPIPAKICGGLHHFTNTSH